MSTEIAALLISSPDVCGGQLRIEGTRVTVNQIVALYKQGYNAEEIADQYPHLTMAQVYAALLHYHTNQDEIDADLAKEKEKAEELEREHRSQHPQSDADKSVHR
ncbi:MAG: hypothetical protein QOH70_1596 [Blastocatellia bacterium]|jgi:uncharacterized protein (DUF433 family)|nr:hypothetical protein [Blastocatellia bacterium]